MVGKLLKALIWTIATLILLAVALYVDSVLGIGYQGWLVIMTLLAAFMGWWRSSKRRKLHIETPTTFVTQSLSGRVELCGHATTLDGHLLRDPVEDQPCVWFAVKSFRGRWPRLTNAKPSIVSTNFTRSGELLLKEAMSSRPFSLRDESGVCLVDPAGAEFDFKPDSVIIDDAAGATHLVWRIAENQPLTILGHFQSTDGGSTYRGKVSKPDNSPYLISCRTPAELEVS